MCLIAANAGKRLKSTRPNVGAAAWCIAQSPNSKRRSSANGFGSSCASESLTTLSQLLSRPSHPNTIGCITPSTTGRLATMSLEGRLWAASSVKVNGPHWPCLTLGWSRAAFEAHSSSSSIVERSWFLSVALDASMDVALPWTTAHMFDSKLASEPARYANSLFAGNDRLSSKTFQAAPTAEAYLLRTPSAFRLSQRRIWDDVLVPASHVIDPFMLRPLSSFAADLRTQELEEDLHLSSLVIGKPFSDAQHDDKLLEFWRHDAKYWKQKGKVSPPGKREALLLGVLRVANTIHDCVETENMLQWSFECTGLAQVVSCASSLVHLTRTVGGESLGASIASCAVIQVRSSHMLTSSNLCTRASQTLKPSFSMITTSRWNRPPT